MQNHQRSHLTRKIRELSAILQTICLFVNRKVPVDYNIRNTNNKEINSKEQEYEQKSLYFYMFMVSKKSSLFTGAKSCV